jgi:cytochrome c-type biogenesis protein CcmH/NrfG
MARSQHPQAFGPMHAVVGVAGILFGVIFGYILGAGQLQPGPAVAAAAGGVPQAEHTAPVADEGELQAYRDILKADPGNVKAAVALANKLYDAHRFAEAVPAYRQALALNPKDVNVSTDLGTALYYAGQVDEALAQLDSSLKIDPTHGQTLFNIGIIRRDGRKDPRGAVEAWETLLKVSPGYPEAARVKSLIAETL